MSTHNLCLGLLIHIIRPNKKYVFRVTSHLLVKPRIFLVFWKKNIYIAICKAICLSKCIKLFFSRKKK